MTPSACACLLSLCVRRLLRLTQVPMFSLEERSDEGKRQKAPDTPEYTNRGGVQELQVLNYLETGLEGLAGQQDVIEGYEPSVMDINSVLPVETLELVFGLLPRRVLLVVLRVCRRWRDVGEAPWLWTSCKLKVTTDNVSQIPELLASRRWMALRCLSLREVSDDLLASVKSHPALQRLEMNYLDLCQADPWLLATTVAGRQTVDMRSCRLTRAQATAIFTAISEGGGLRSLEIGPMNNLSTVAPRVMASAVNSLERAEMRGTHLSREQVTSILLQAATKTRLHFLDLRGNWAVREVSRELVVAARRNIREVYCQ